MCDGFSEPKGRRPAAVLRIKQNKDNLFFCKECSTIEEQICETWKVDMFRFYVMLPLSTVSSIQHKQ